MSIKSVPTTLNKITADGLAFNVPIYQRLYVWGSDQIDMLLEDLLTAFQQDKEFFYLGGTLVVERQGDAAGFDLIDGQQRFTTLWMMSLAWQGALKPFLEIPQEASNRPRISFSIRPEVDAFFAARRRHENSTEPGPPGIMVALDRITAFRDGFGKQRDKHNQPLDFHRFTDFVFRKVQLVLTRVPPHTDLNKLFEVINNRGLQLQHHEILKAKLLQFLAGDAAELDRYAALWDACSHMTGYVEKNLRDATGIRIADFFDNEIAGLGQEDLAKAELVLAALRQHRQAEESAEPLDLEQVLALTGVEEAGKGNTDSDIYESREVRSIVTFPMLLQHTLRIWLARQPGNRTDLPRILDKELLDIFSSHFLNPIPSADDVRSFIRLLWETRYAFDKHVIKWVMEGEEERHAICSPYLNTSDEKSRYLQRRMPRTGGSGSRGAFALLQSMLYHSQQITTHYWLTPLLSYLLKNPGSEGDHRFDYLRYLDNHLLSSTDDRSLVERSNDFLRDPDHKPQLVDIAGILSQSDGVRFSHYWFYKLEFVLWYTNHLNLPPAKHAAFRMTAKNSIEHISPQLAQSVDRDTVSAEVLDTFGNLALVSRSLNSEYGNKPYNEKRQHFLNHNRDRIDSLKMAAIYRSPTWGDAEAVEHQKGMIALLQSYLATGSESFNHNATR